MNGKIDFLNWTVKPDQMQVINPLIILLFIPLFEIIVYPILAKIRIQKPLQKITIGGFLAALAFVLSAFVQNKIIVSSFPKINMIFIYAGFYFQWTLSCNNIITVSNFRTFLPIFSNL